MSKIYGVKRTQNINLSQFNSILATLPTDRKNLINDKHRKEDKDLGLLSHILLRYILIKEFNIPLKKMILSIGKYGKPFLRSIPGIHFNLSHSGDWAVLAVSNKEIGIDVEKTKVTNFDIAKEYFNISEYEYLSSMPANRKTETFFRLWTIKESYIKAIGLGFNKSLKSFSVIEKNIITDFTIQNDIIWNYDYSKLDDDHHISVCFQDKDSINPIIIYNSNKLIKNYRKQYIMRMK